MLDSRIPSGPIEQTWNKCRFEMKLVNPANRRKHSIIVVGAGLAGAAAAATLGQQGYQVHCVSYHDTPRRAHSIAAQGGINAAKNYRNDGDSVFRLFYDTVKGGDFRAREANVYRLAEISANIIDQCVAQGVPFAREYGGKLDTRSFGGVQVQRTFYARGQTGQQLLLGAYQALEEQIAAGTVTMHTRTEVLDIVLVNGRARGVVTRHLPTGTIESLPPTWSCWPPVDMGTCSTCRPMPRHPMPVQSGGLTGGAPFLETLASPRFTPPAFPRAASINPSSR